MPEPGSVHALAPLTVQLDSSTTPQPAVNMASVTLVVADRVDVDPVGKQLHILGSERSGIPAGCTMIWWVPTLPPGWIVIDGVDKSRALYPALFAAWGTYYGVGDGSTTFGIPSPLGRSVVGQDPSQTEFATLGQVGGAKTHLLTTPEIPSHNHIQDTHNHVQDVHGHVQNAHAHTQNLGGNLSTVLNATGSYVVGDANNSTTASTTATNQGTTATNQTTVATNQTAGGGTAHSILNPSITAVFIVKT